MTCLLGSRVELNRDTTRTAACDHELTHPAISRILAETNGTTTKPIPVHPSALLCQAHDVTSPAKPIPVHPSALPCQAHDVTSPAEPIPGLPTSFTHNCSRPDTTIWRCSRTGKSFQTIRPTPIISSLLTQVGFKPVSSTPVIDKVTSWTTASYNVNGIWKRYKRGDLRRWLTTTSPDILLLSEVKLYYKSASAIRELEAFFTTFGYHYFAWHLSAKQHLGQYGTAVISKHEPIQTKFGYAHATEASDTEGRLITMDFRHFSYVLSYSPCSAYIDVCDSNKRLAKETRRKHFDAQVLLHLQHLRGRRFAKPIIFTGDLNIAYLPKDVYDSHTNPLRQYYPNSKIWEINAFKDLLQQLSFEDAIVRHLPIGSTSVPYTHWETDTHYKNKQGRRIDHVIADSSLLRADSIQRNRCSISSAWTGISRFGSDHCPIYHVISMVPTTSLLATGSEVMTLDAMANRVLDDRRATKRAKLASKCTPTASSRQGLCDIVTGPADQETPTRKPTHSDQKTPTKKPKPGVQQEYRSPRQRRKLKRPVWNDTIATATGRKKHAISSIFDYGAPLSVTNTESYDVKAVKCPSISHLSNITPTLPESGVYPDFKMRDENDFDTDFDAYIHSGIGDAKRQFQQHVLDSHEGLPMGVLPQSYRGVHIAQTRACSLVSASVPIADVSFGELQYRTLFDSGASYSILDANIAREIRKRTKSWLTLEVDSNTAPNFTLANESTVRPCSRLRVPMTLSNGATVSQDFWVLPKISTGVILGCDFFMKYGVMIDFKSKAIRFSGLDNAAPIPFEIKHASASPHGALSPLLTAHDLYLPPASRTGVTLRVFEGDCCQQGKAPVMINRFGRGYNPKHAISTTLATIEDGFTVAGIANFTPHPVFVPAGMLVGMAEVVTIVTDESEIQGSDEVFELHAATDERDLEEQKLNRTNGYDDSLIHEHAEQSSDSLLHDDPDPGRKIDAPLNEHGYPSDIDLSWHRENLTQSQYAELVELLVQYNDIFTRTYSGPPATDQMEMKIDIDDGVMPHSAPVRRVNPATRTIIIDYARKLLKAGVIEPSTSAWNSNLLIVKKKTGGYRVCCDWRRVNQVTKPMSSNLPPIQQNLDCLGGSKFFTALDCCDGYFSLPLEEQSRPYTAFNVPGHGSYQFTRAGQGLRNSQQYFVALTNKMLRDLNWKCCATFSDDVIVFSPTWARHIEDLRQVFERFRRFNLKIKGKKVSMAQKELSYCGYLVTVDGIRADPKKVETIDKIEQPRTLKALRRFLGCCQWLAKFIPHYALMSEPLRPLTRKGRFTTKWNQEQVNAFNKLKVCLKRAPLLRHPDWTKPFEVHADAAPSCVAAVLIQRDTEGNPHPVSYLSRALNDTQQKYAHWEKELLSVLYALESWRSYCAFTKTAVYTDSEAVKFLQAPSSKYKGRCLRMILKLSSFDIVWHWRPGKQHIIPDMLSRSVKVTSGAEPRVQIEPLCNIYLAHHEVAITAPVMTRAGKKGLFDASETDIRNDPDYEKHSEIQSILPLCPEDDTVIHGDGKHCLNPKRESDTTANVERTLLGQVPDTKVKGVPAKVERTLLGQVPDTKVIHGDGKHCLNCKRESDTTANVERTLLGQVPDTKVKDTSHTQATDTKYNADSKKDAADHTIDSFNQMLMDALNGKTHEYSPPVVDSFDRRQIQHRGDLVLFAQVVDLKALFQERSKTDKQIVSLTDRLAAHDDTCDHKDKCILRHWVYRDGLIWKKTHKERKSVPPTEIVGLKKKRILLQIAKHRQECKCHGTCWTTRWSTDNSDANNTRLFKNYYRSKPKKCSRLRLFVPESLVTSVLYHFHGSATSGHPGKTKCAANVGRRFYWPCLHKHVSAWCGACLPCQLRTRPRPQNVVPPGEIPVSYPWQYACIDHLGPFPTSNRNNRYIFSIICPFLRWPIIVPCPDQKADTVCRILLEYLIQNHTAPTFLLSDNAATFIGKTVSDFCSIFGIKHKTIPKYSPWLNSYCERYNAWISQTLTVMTNRYKTNWDDMVPLVNMAYRTSIHGSTGFSPFMALYGREPRLHTDLIFDSPPEFSSLSQYVTSLQEQLQHVHREMRISSDSVSARNMQRRGDKFRVIQYEVGDLVLRYEPVSGETLPKHIPRTFKLLDRWTGPHRIICTHEDRPGYYDLQSDNGEVQQSVRADSMVLYTPYLDGSPSLIARQKFTAEQRRAENKARRDYVLPDLKKGMMAVFPLRMPDGSYGFGVGKIVSVSKHNVNLHWYSNREESLEKAFTPCWLMSNKKWYVDMVKRHKSHKTFTTKAFYPLPITRDTIADAGFQLTAQGLVPELVLTRIEQHPKYHWKRSL